jgi:hypothetical protein
MAAMVSFGHYLRSGFFQRPVTVYLITLGAKLLGVQGMKKPIVDMLFKAALAGGNGAATIRAKVGDPRICLLQACQAIELSHLHDSDRPRLPLYYWSIALVTVMW